MAWPCFSRRDGRVSLAPRRREVAPMCRREGWWVALELPGGAITSVVRYVSAPSSLVLTCGTWLRARTSLVLLARHTYTIVVLTFVYTLTIARGWAEAWLWGMVNSNLKGLAYASMVDHETAR